MGAIVLLAQIQNLKRAGERHIVGGVVCMSIATIFLVLVWIADEDVVIRNIGAGSLAVSEIIAGVGFLVAFAAHMYLVCKHDKVFDRHLRIVHHIEPFMK